MSGTASFCFFACATSALSFLISASSSAAVLVASCRRICLGLERLVALVEFRLQRLQLLRGHGLVARRPVSRPRKAERHRRQARRTARRSGACRCGPASRGCGRVPWSPARNRAFRPAAAMHGLVAQVFDDARFHEHFLRHQTAKRRLVDQGRKRIVIRQGKRGIVRVQPVDRQFQRPPGIEAGGARIGQRERFHARGRRVEFRPLGF